MPAIKRCCATLCTTLYVCVLVAQSNLSKVEYFYDTDPGFGLGTVAALPASGSVDDFIIDASTGNLTAGFHWLFIRVQEVGGKWSETQRMIVYKPDVNVGEQPAPALTGFEYFYDTDPGFGQGTAVPVANGVTTVDDFIISVPTTALSAGFHWLFIRSKNVAGKWSETQRMIVYKPDVNVGEEPVSALTGFEYFYDVDPGFGQGTAVPVANGVTTVDDFIFSVPTTALSAGFHWLFIRSKNVAGKWSETQRIIVYKPDVNVGEQPAPALTGFEYFYDVDPGFGQGTAVPVANGVTTIDDFIISVPTTALSAGFHWLFIRSKNVAGKWSETQRLIVYKPEDGPIQPAPNLVYGEYFLDTDPGFGHGIPLLFTSATEIADAEFPVCTVGLSIGLHRLLVRIRDANGKWSETAATDLSLCLSGGAITGNQSVTFNGDPSLLDNITNAVVNPANLVNGQSVTYSWQKWTGSVPACSATFTGIPGANAITYDPPAGATTATYYRREARYQGSNGVCIAHSNAVLVEVDPASLPPVNDNCAQAIELIAQTGSSCGSAVTGGTQNATRSIPDNCLGAANDDVWYRFVAVTSSEKVLLNRSGLPGSGIELQLFSGTCGTLTPVAGCVQGASSATQHFDGLTVGATYYLRVYTPGLIDFASFDICVVSQPVLSLVSIQKVCNQTNGSIIVNSIGGTAPYTYAICSGLGCNSGFGLPQSSGTFSNLIGGDYTVRVTDSNGATATVTANTQGIALSVQNTQNETCSELNNGSVVLVANTLGTLPYSFAVGGSIPANGTGTFNNLSAGNYVGTVTDAGGCMATAAFVITEPVPDPRYQDADGDGYGNPNVVVHVCNGQTPVGYVTIVGDCNDNNAAVYPGAIEICDGLDNDCDGIVDNNLTPVVQITASVTTLSCTQQSSLLQVVVQGGGNYTYLWSNGTTGASTIVTAPGEYSVLVATVGGCSALATKSILSDTSLGNTGILSNPANRIINCTHPFVQLSAYGGTVYQWSTTATTAAVAVYDPGYYSVAITGSNGCVSHHTILITLDTLHPNTAITGPNLVCGGNPLTLTVDGNYSVQWSNGQTGSSIMVQPSTDTFFTAIITASNGCFIVDTQVVVVNAQNVPGVATNRQPAAFATGLPETVVLSWDSVAYAKAYRVYYWYQDSAVNSTGLLDTTHAFISVLAEKEVFWTIEAINDCAATLSDTISFTTQGIQPPSNEDCSNATPIQITTTCRLATLNYPFSLSGAQPGAPTGTCRPVTPDVWFSFQPHIEYYTFNTVSLTGDTAISEFIVELYDGSCGQLLQKKCFVNTTAYFDNLIPNHTYYIRLARSGPSSFSGFFNLKPDYSKTYTVSADTTICAGGTAMLSASGGASYLWWDNSTQPTYQFQPDASLKPWVIVYNQNCSELHYVAVSVIKHSYIFPDKDSMGVCAGSSLALKVKNATAATWSNGQTGLSINYLPTTDTSLLILTANNDFCVFRDSLKVTVSHTYPDVPVLIAPVDTMDLQEQDLFFEWEPANGATLYDIYVWKDGEPEAEVPVIIDSKITRVFFTIVNPVFNAKYFWRVVAKNNTCGVASTIGSFRMKTLPDLEVTNIQVPNHIICGENITISYTVRNNGPGYTGFNRRWYDKVYFSDDNTLQDTIDAYLGPADNLSALYPGQTYTGSATFHIPIDAVFEGQFYVIINTGFYRVKNIERKFAQVNYTNDIKVSAQKVTVVLPDESDLQITHATCPSNFFSKSKIPLSWTVKNFGPGKTNKSGWADQVRLVRDTVTMADAFVLGAASNSFTLYNDSTYSRAITSNKIPPEYSGLYFAVFEADAQNVVWEHVKETNNRYIIPVNIILSPAPDLVSKSLVLPDTIYYGVPINGACKVANEGFSAVEDPTFHTARLQHQGAVPGDQDILMNFSQDVYLNAGNSVSLNGTGILRMNKDSPPPRSGVYELPLLRVDAGDAIFENLGEDNNDSIYQLQTVLVAPDLIVSSVTTPTPMIVAGDLLEIKYKVKNIAFLFNHDKWRDEVYFTQTPDPNAPKVLSQEMKISNASIFFHNATRDTVARFALACNLAPGTYYCWVKTDIENEITETDNDNNLSAPLSVVITAGDCSVDLLVRNLKVPAEIPYCTDFTVQYTVKNNGPNPVVIGGKYDAVTGGYEYYDLLALRDDTLQTVDYDFSILSPLGTLTRLLPQDTILVTANLRIRDEAEANPGHYNFMVRINASNWVQEIDYNNNFAFATVFLDTFSKPDLVIRLDSIPSEVISGQSFTLKMTNRNKGTGATVGNDIWSNILDLSPVPYNLNVDEDGNCQESYLCNISPYSSCDCSGVGGYLQQVLGPGEAKVKDLIVTIPASTPTGIYYLIATTDPKGYICEMREDNNQFVAMIRVRRPDPGDLTVLNVRHPTTVKVAEPFTIQWTLKNMGVSPVNGNMREAVYLSKDQSWSSEDILMGYQNGAIILGAGMETERSIAAKVTKAALEDYYVIVRTDVLDNIWETDNHNNEAGSGQALNIVFPLLPVGEQDTIVPMLRNGQALYYRIDTKPEHIGQTILVTITTPDSVAATNQLYLRRGILPSLDDFDYRSLRSGFGNQETFIPTAEDGNYFLMVDGSMVGGDSQMVHLKAVVLPFSIRSVQTAKGGDNGFATVLLRGARLDPDMQIALQRDTTTIVADSIGYIDATKAFVRFDLRNKPLGAYTVQGMHPGGDTASWRYYEIIPGGPPKVVVYLRHPAQVRVRGFGPGPPGTVRPMNMTVEFENQSSIDIPIPLQPVRSIGGAPLAFTSGELPTSQTDELLVPLRELEGPVGYLRAGAKGSVLIWVNWGRKAMVFVVEEQDDDN